MAISNIPVGTVSRESGIYSTDYSMLPLPPASAAIARTVIGTLSLAGAAQTIEIAEGASFITIYGGDYGAAVRYSAGVTADNFDEVIMPGLQQLGIPDGTAEISIDAATDLLPIIIIQR